MRHPVPSVRSIVAVALAAGLASCWSGCALNAEGEGLFDDDASMGGGMGGALPDVMVDVSAEDAIPDIPPPPDVPCFPPKKLCGSVCDFPDPFIMGCSPNADECDPCPHYAHAEVECRNGACALGACEALWADCDGNPSNGCETPINTIDNCGACGKTCSRNNAVADCSAGQCSILQCVTPFKNCDGVDANGCETNLHSMDNCGACGVLCQGPGPAQYTCATGECKVDQCTQPLTADCDGNPSNGCETDLTTLANCGACGTTCSRAHATATCAGGTCAIKTCSTGYGDCDSNDDTGCETNLQTNTANCGACGGGCSTVNAANVACQNGRCAPACSDGWADYNGPQPGNNDDGCETRISSDPLNCGGCGKACSNNHVPTPSCTFGLCDGSCQAGYDDCDGNKLVNGCEVNTTNDPDNCGACKTVCSNNHMATRTCSASVCNGTCAAGYADCNNNKQTDGCEQNVATDVNNCGACGKICSSNNIPTRACTAGVCSGACAAGYDDCNNNKQTDGCEINTTNDPNNCGACNTVCSNNHMATRTCSASMCNGTCATDYADCNNNKQTDGCEINTTNDVNHCGSCTNVCQLDHAVEACVSSACAIASCEAHYGNCDGDITTGCETDLDTDVDHCGACTRPCSTSHAASLSCNAGLCDTTDCDNGWTNTSRPAAPTADDGCESHP